MKSCSNISPIVRSQENDIVSETKSIIEIEVAAKHYYIYFYGKIKKTAKRFHYTTKTISKLNVTSMNCQRAGYH